jgi:peptidoglycan/LPS O-acetylase OafA/YrhL
VLLLSVLAIPGQRHPWPALATHVLMTLFLAACLVRPRNPLAPILNFKPIAYVGVVSYGIYLYHMHLRHVCVALMHLFGTASPWLTFVLMTAASIGVASLSYHLLELPILAYRSRFVRTEAGRPAANAK